MVIKFFYPTKPHQGYFNVTQTLLMSILFFSTFSGGLAASDNNSDFNKETANIIFNVVGFSLNLSLIIAFCRILTLLTGRPYASLQGVPIYADDDSTRADISRDGAPLPCTCGGDEELYNRLRNGSPTFLELVAFGFDKRICASLIIISLIYNLLSSNSSSRDLSYKEVANFVGGNILIGSTIFSASVGFFRFCCTANGRIRASNEGYSQEHHGPIYGSISSAV